MTRFQGVFYVKDCCRLHLARTSLTCLFRGGRLVHGQLSAATPRHAARRWSMLLAVLIREPPHLHPFSFPRLTSQCRGGRSKRDHTWNCVARRVRWNAGI